MTETIMMIIIIKHSYMHVLQLERSYCKTNVKNNHSPKNKISKLKTTQATHKQRLKDQLYLKDCFWKLMSRPTYEM